MNKILALRGCPASGKTTYANKYIKEHNQCAYVRRFNRDDIRRELFPTEKWPGYKYSKANEKEVTTVQEERITDFVTEPGYRYRSIAIVDDTNLNAKTLKRFKDIAELWDVEFEVKDFFDVPLHKLFQRNLERLHSVPEAAIIRFFKKQLEIQGRIIKKTGKDLTYIFDIDGTLALMGKGESWGRMPYEWDKVINDRPNESVVSLCRDIIETSAMGVIFMSGRDGVCFDDTRKWLDKHKLYGQLFLRSPGDSRPDCVVKEEMLREHVLPNNDVYIYFEDRNQMVDHWRCLGIDCWQVAEGRF